LKIGLEAFVAHGPRLVREVVELAPQVFLDLKLHDIPATVRRATANVAGCGARMITVHASGGRAMLEAAVEGGAGRRGRLSAAGRRRHPAHQPRRGGARRARPARPRRGHCGAVGSDRSAQRRRRGCRVSPGGGRGPCGCGPDFLIVTPGIRPAGHQLDDQRRAATPAEAVRAGADILVVGRPISGAAAPLDAAQRILEEMARAASE